MINYAKSVPLNQWLAATEKGLCYAGRENGTQEEMIHWLKKNFPDKKIVANKQQMKEYLTAFECYFAGTEKEFSFLLDLKATPFTLEVWQALMEIGYGETSTYSEIAQKIGRPKAVRAVGRAIGANPVLVVVPCHRIIGKSGKLTGYRGGLKMKAHLLKLENGESYPIKE